MALILLLGLALAGTAFALVLRAVAFPRARAAESIAQIDQYGYGATAPDEAPQGALRATVDGLASLVGRLVTRRGVPGREERMRIQLMSAGLYNLQPSRFLGYRVLCAITFPVMWLWAAVLAGFPGKYMPFILILAAAGGWAIPMSLVRRRADRRLSEIDYELPELIDLLVVTVEAGLGFTGSLRLAAERIKGPLGEELGLTLQEQSMGLSTIEGLRHMLERCDTPSMRSFVRSVLQGEALGVSIGEIMRNLALEMRKRRRQGAEERAQKAPVKMLFPLIFLIFPAMFVVLLLPAFYTLAHNLG